MDPPALAAGQVEQGKLAWGNDWSALGRGWAAGRGRVAPEALPLEPSPSFMCTHPVIHVLLGGSSQMHRPPLPGPLRRVQGEGVLGLIEHRDQHRHLVEEHVNVLLTESGGRAVTRPEGGPVGLGAQWASGWSPCHGGGTGMAWGTPDSREPVLGVPPGPVGLSGGLWDPACLVGKPRS